MNAWQYVVLLGAVILGFSFIAPKKKQTSSGSQASFIQEMEETIEHFVSEVESENRELLKVLADLKKEHESQLGKVTEKLEMLEKRTFDLSSDVSKQMQRIDQQNLVLTSITSSSPTVLPSRSINEQASVIIPPPVDLRIKNRYKELFEWHEQGKSIEFIAKKLEMNKGEVQLILQLSKQEEQARA